MKKEELEKDYKPIVIYAVLTLFLVSFVIGIILGITGHTDMLETEEGTGLIGILNTFISYVIIAPIFIFLYRKKIKSDLKEFKIKYVIMASLTAIFLAISSSLISTLFEMLHIPMENQSIIVDTMKKLPIATSFVLVVLAPIVEEFVFRYSIFTFTKNPRTAIIVSSILFAVVHGIGIATFIYFFMGACFGLLYYKTNKNIGVTILTHAINNALSVISILLI